jgi:hypothetical protein
LSEPAAAAPVSQPPAVEFTYTLTLDDLREALRPAPTEEQRKQRDKRLARQAGLPGPQKAPSEAARFGKGIFGWVLFIGLSAALIMLLNKNQRPASASPPPTPYEPAVDLWLSVIPSALGAAGVGAFVFMMTLAAAATARRRRTPNRVPDTPSRIIVAGLLVSMGLVFAALWVMVEPPFEIAWRPQRMHVALLAAAPWVIVFFAMFAVFRTVARRGTKTMYGTNPTFQRMHTSRMDAEGIHEDDGVTKILYRWSIFTRAWETANLLVLDDEANRRHMLPKRALIESGQLEPARAQIVSHVPVSDLFFTPGAFPVNRVPTAPIPAIPLGSTTTPQ